MARRPPGSSPGCYLQVALLVCAVTGCGEEPGGKFEASIGSPFEAEVESLATEPVTFAAALQDYGAVASAGTFLRFDPISGAATDYGAGAGEIASAASISDGTLVVSGSEGIFAVQGRTLVPSPLGEVVASESPPALFVAPGPVGDDLWIGSADSILLWRGGEVLAPDLGGLPVAGARFAYGSAATDGGDPAVWVATEADVYGLADAGGDALRAYPDGHSVAPTGIGADARGLLWVASSGKVHRRHEDGTWDWTSLPDPVVTLAASHRRRDVWIQTEQSLFHTDGGDFREVSNAPTGALVAVDPAGRALLVGDEGLHRVAAGRLLLLSGLGDGTELVGFAIVTIIPTRAEGLVSIEATIDEAPAEVSADPWRVNVDPIGMSDGAHSLTVSATYDDSRAPVTASLYFSVGEFEPATWSRDVEPLFVDNCKKCHGPDGGAHRLDTAARWENDIDKVLEMTTSQRMPLPPNDPLTDEEIQLIQSWRAGGFPE